MKIVIALLLIGNISPLYAQTDFWQRTNELNGTYVTAVATNASGHVFAATSDSGLFRSTDDGASWVNIRSQYVGSVVVAPDGRIYVPGIDSGRTYIFGSSDNGETWNKLGGGWCKIILIGGGCTPPDVHIATGSQQRLFTAVGYHAHDIDENLGIWRSTNLGLTWDSLARFGGYAALYSDRDDRLFACVRSYDLEPPFSTFRSTDQGTTWSHADSGLTRGYSWINTLAFNSANQAYAGVDNTIFRSSNHGDIWTVYDTVDAGISEMIFDQNDSLYVATNGEGVYRNGNQVNSGLTNLYVTSIAVSPAGYIYAGTADSGVFRSVLPTVGVKETSGEQPSSFLLHQNYPNPFNASTRIRFDIPQAGYVILRVFDLLGREVARLVDGESTPGRFEIPFDASELSSGVYFYRLEVQSAGRYTETKKLLLLR